ncbi:MAG: hypothetical protein ABL984_03490 [Pyrinomonadaceae bacterium]
MNKTLTCISVLAMMLLADALCIKQTIEFRELIANSTMAVLLSVEGTAAGIFVASAVSLLRKQFVRQKKPVSRRPVAAAVQA